MQSIKRDRTSCKYVLAVCLGRLASRYSRVVLTREEIIQAVRQQAALNGGAPVGKRRFQSQTGIGDSAWAGKFWVRWNDLLVDAGFSPNEWNSQSHDREQLLTLLAQFTLELGHFPIIAEKNFRARSDPDFPYDSSFRKHVGSNQPEQAQALAEFALRHPEFPGLYELCAPLLPKVSKTPSDASVAPSAVGRVYLIRRFGSDHYKIGESENPDRRVRELQTGASEKLVLVHVLETDDPNGIERYWHHRFRHQGRAGEWFELTLADVEAFKRRGRFM